MNAETKWTCEFCNKKLISERNLVKHMCVPKQRFQEQDTATARLAHQLWTNFYHTIQPGKACTVNEFIRSSYYPGFWRFADYCRTSGVFAVAEYQRWLLKNRHSVDRWCRDELYTRFLLTYIPGENALDSVHRSVQTLMTLAEETEYAPKDYLRYSSGYKICQNIVSGKITAWFLYNCSSGTDFLSKRDESQLSMIWDYIEPEPWQARFRIHKHDQQAIVEILKSGGF